MVKPHSIFSAVMIQAVGHTFNLSKSSSSCTISFRSFRSNNNGPQMNMVWHKMIESCTISGVLLQAPHIAWACSSI